MQAKKASVFVVYLFVDNTLTNRFCCSSHNLKTTNQSELQATTQIRIKARIKSALRACELFVFWLAEKVAQMKLPRRRMFCWLCGKSIDIPISNKLQYLEKMKIALYIIHLELALLTFGSGNFNSDQSNLSPSVRRTALQHKYESLTINAATRCQ